MRIAGYDLEPSTLYDQSKLKRTMPTRAARQTHTGEELRFWRECFPLPREGQHSPHIVIGNWGNVCGLFGL